MCGRYGCEMTVWVYGILSHLMQEFCQIVQGKGERVQTFVHLKWALKVIKQQHCYAMTEEEGIKHLKDIVSWAKT